jgi:hypothetical protein
MIQTSASLGARQLQAGSQLARGVHAHRGRDRRLGKLADERIQLIAIR